MCSKLFNLHLGLCHHLSTIWPPFGLHQASPLVRNNTTAVEKSPLLQDKVTYYSLMSLREFSLRR